MISGAGSFQEVIFNTGRRVRTAGGSYLALPPISDSAMFAPPRRRGTGGRARNGRPVGEERAGFVFYNDGDDPSLLTSTSWGPLRGVGGVAWTVGFAPAPGLSELANRAWLGAGLVALGLMGKLRSL